MERRCAAKVDLRQYPVYKWLTAKIGLRFYIKFNQSH